MAVLFVISIFISAALLFAVQPMIGRLVLPTLGGSPAVWNTVMVFFQASLLAGYALAHGIGRLRSQRLTVAIHAVIVIAAAASLPVGFVITRWASPESPVAGLIVGLGLGVGLPALALATMSPILQRWYSLLNLRRSNDPYFLYAASNAGSLIGLLGYPLLLEPRLGLSDQRIYWAVGFLVLSACLVGIWFRLIRTRSILQSTGESESTDDSPRVSTASWVVLSLVPSSLLLGVTQHISADVAAIPLFWAVPLALYLVTFIIAFSGKASTTARVMSRVVPIVAVAVTVAILMEAKHPLAAVMALHLVAFFAIALGCHARLAESRPSPKHLTRFYLCMSIGGVLGGAVNALVAPNLLSWIAEYPIMIAIGAGLCVGWPVVTKKAIIELWTAAVFAMLLAAALFVLPKVVEPDVKTLLLTALPAVGCFLLSTKPMRFALALLAALLLPEFIDADHHLIHRERTFFGVHTVYEEDADGQLRHVLRHGGTIHGLQNIGSTTPQTYYHPTGPVGDVFELVQADANIGAIGLGVGSIAGSARPGDRLTFYEIDPEVVRIAQDTELFTFTAESLADIEFVIGDGRLTIADAEPMDLLIVDAFTSDAIPAHLLTVEAFATYTDRLKPGGIIMMHLSNRYLDLEPVVAATATQAGLVGLIRHDVPNSTELTEGKLPSTWVVFAKDLSVIGSLTTWRPPESREGVRAWTDDYANILGVLRLD